ncbi:hypothetical protein K435DRAFT_873614 [Dendrothele bispora CBS 962.96]|uniref:Uncharacterized protein n=1 Tax=Dendrothele bispora (strain CBS 962.96) TaxID=1314807 RepID=A0A4S8KZ14_DENBC|nr:hypothetical protein K435DRAFT_873614 [Dendrothele bispora CBS 962.96]
MNASGSNILGEGPQTRSTSAHANTTPVHAPLTGPRSNVLTPSINIFNTFRKPKPSEADSEIVMTQLGPLQGTSGSSELSPMDPKGKGKEVAVDSGISDPLSAPSLTSTVKLPPNSLAATVKNFDKVSEQHFPFHYDIPPMGMPTPSKAYVKALFKGTSSQGPTHWHAYL